MTKKLFIIEQIGAIEFKGRAGVGVGEVEFWITSSFAEGWYLDAAEQAARPKDKDAVRRQIVFAVALAETYLFEWVRDSALKRQFGELVQYFPTKGRTRVEEKWKTIPKRLFKDGHVSGAFEAGKSRAWVDFTRLVDFRNGLVHGGASRPDARSGRHPRPMPTRNDFESIGATWPLDVVTRLIKELHAAEHTQPPVWLK